MQLTTTGRRHNDHSLNDHSLTIEEKEKTLPTNAHTPKNTKAERRVI